MFVAKYKLYKSIKSNVKDGFNTDDSDNKDDYIFRYVISIAGTKPFSIFAAVFQDLSIFKTRPWNKREPWSKAIRDKTLKNNKPTISSGIRKRLKLLLTNI